MNELKITKPFVCKETEYEIAGNLAKEKDYERREILIKEDRYCNNIWKDISDQINLANQNGRIWSSHRRNLLGKYRFERV